MSVADDAVNGALHFEAVKYAYRQTKDGVVISLVVHPNDIPAELSSSHIGSRYMVALVELGDDETPKKPSKKDWREMTPASQAGIRCAEVRFRNFLALKHKIDTKTTEEAATAVRKMCGVASRMELATNHKARTLWHQIDTDYREWAHL